MLLMGGGKSPEAQEVAVARATEAVSGISSETHTFTVFLKCRCMYVHVLQVVPVPHTNEKKMNRFCL